MDKPLTLGSLFSGSGGFELSGLLCGIKPLWASEVEPFPIRVTTKRLPQVRHLGDINTINGATVPPVDIITGGFCCQDLSVAGKRAGLHGERSGLFFQVVRIIKGMREATGNEYPRFAVLENVPGIYSSAGGADFLEVLNELINIKQEGIAPDETLSISMPESGKWSTAGEIVGDGFSLGWRTLDAQFWGVAQRRRRCYIVLDLTGERAGKILFDETRLRGNPPPCGFPWQAAAGNSAAGAGRAVPCLMDQGGSKMEISDNITGTLRSQEHGHQPVVIESAGFCTEHSAKARGVGFEDEKSPTLRSSVVPAAVIYDARGNGDGETANTVTGDHNGHISDYTALAVTPRAFGICSKNSNSMLSDNPLSGVYEAATSRTLDTSVPDPNKNAGGMAIVAFAQNQRDEVRDLRGCAGALAAAPGMKQQTFIASIEDNGARPRHRGSGISENRVSPALNTIERRAVAYQDKVGALCASDYKFPQNMQVEQGKAVVERVVAENYQHSGYREIDMAGVLKASGGDFSGGENGVAENCQPGSGGYIVRRLLPSECALLQGFPPWWCTELETPDPTEEDIAFWSEVWETHRRAISKSSKPKSRAQIIKWLQNPHSDSKEYAMWGNGICLNCGVFVLGGIVYYCRMTAPNEADSSTSDCSEMT
ncbi:MAG: DNA cytosine methyltransferase [Firmicutes bacterium]|nr:DNA cytosine methyltransferase [Bacillota bacterium]